MPPSRTSSFSVLRNEPKQAWRDPQEENPSLRSASASPDLLDKERELLLFEW